MRRRKSLLAVAVLAFLAGASLDDYLRGPGAFPDCYCSSAKCRIVSVADHPLIALSNPLETLDSLRTALRPR